MLGRIAVKGLLLSYWLKKRAEAAHDCWWKHVKNEVAE